MTMWKLAKAIFDLIGGIVLLIWLCIFLWFVVSHPNKVVEIWQWMWN